MKIELVFIPCPLIGHLRATADLAKLLIAQDERFSVTFIIIPRPPGGDDGASASLIASLSTASNDRLRYKIIITEDQPTVESKTPESLVQSHKPEVREAVSKLVDRKRLAGFVVDMFCTPMIDLADEFGVPSYVFYTSNAAFLGLLFHVQFLCDEKNYDVSELDLEDSDVKLVVPSLDRPYPVKCLPYVFTSKEWFPIFLNQARRFRKTKGILVNTIAELEPFALKSLSSGDTPLAYPVGPLLDLKNKPRDSLDDKQSEILEWLNQQMPGSVVFLCFGSMGGFSEEQEREIAVALERSGHRFLWSLRRASPNIMNESPGEFTNLEEFLPEGFLDRTKEMGKVIGWAPQVAVLASPAIGGFVSHCGWNSTLESLWFGVPTATWPLSAEQKLNAFEMVEELGLAVEMKKYLRGDLLAGWTEMVTADEIERGIRCLMEQDCDVRNRVKEMSEKCHVAIMEGGSSETALQKFIRDVTDNFA